MIVCPQGALLQQRWYAGDRQAGELYRGHRASCPDCRRAFEELARAAEQARHPELDLRGG